MTEHRKTDIDAGAKTQVPLEDLAREAAGLQEKICAFLPQEEAANAAVLHAMRYSLEAGGKRLRPIVLLRVGAMYGAPEDLTLPFAAALEMIHTYSLVHDDLPAMDNDDLRRGKPTTHRVYGEGMAILAGDGLLTHAALTALSAYDKAADQNEKDRVLRAAAVLLENAGVGGMIGGQNADLLAEEKSAGEEAETFRHALTPEEKILYIHKHKTAAMLESAFTIGAILGGAPEEEVEALRQIAEHVGVAFQIRDDILDVIGEEGVLGKKPGSDEAAGKLTYVSVHGMEAAQREVERRSAEALALLEGLSAKDAALAQLIEQMTGRNR